MTERTASMRQASELLRIFEDLPAQRLQGIGQALLHLVRERLAQEPDSQKPIALKTVRQVLGLSPMAEEALAVVHWREVQPAQHFEAAVIRQPAKPRCTTFARLRPTDVGLPNDAHRNDVIELALSWGYQRVPRGALDEFLRNPPMQGYYRGFATVPLREGQYTYLFIGGGIREVERMVPESTDYKTTWSVIMAC